MYFRKLFQWKRNSGVIIVSTLILLSTIQGVLTITLTVANKIYENHAIVIDSIKRENISNQTLSILESWFHDSILNEVIHAPSNLYSDDQQCDNPVYYMPSSLVSPILNNTENMEITAFVIDAYYNKITPEIELAETPFIEPHKFIERINNADHNYFKVRHYFLNIMVKLKPTDKVVLHTNKEILVLRDITNKVIFLNSTFIRQQVNIKNNLYCLL